jgi:hypothetical protein
VTRMQVSPRIFLPVLALVGLLLALNVVGSPHAQSSASRGDVDGARYRLNAADAKRSGALLLTQSQRDETFHFESNVATSDRQIFLDAVAEARPEAQRVIGLIDGLVAVRIGPTGVSGAIGLTQDLPGAPGGYAVTVDLGLVAQRYGQRGIARTVLHELGHVVDHALLTDEVVGAMDAQIPAGVGCEEGMLGACASREERFAETFAKWALGDIGVNLDIGYKVPPPSTSLNQWGEPLAQMAAGA